MFQHTKYLIAALGLLLSSSLFASQFNNVTNDRDQTTTTNNSDWFRQTFEVCDPAPQRPENVPSEAFFAQDIMGFNGMWLLQSPRYRVVDCNLRNGHPTKLEPVFHGIHPSLLPNQNHAEEWRHIDKIYLENGTRFFVLEFWRDYNKNGFPTPLEENILYYARAFYSKFPEVVVNEEILQTILDSESHQPRFTPSGLLLTRTNSMEKHMDQLMDELMAQEKQLL